jgi:hypothetical protein
MICSGAMQSFGDPCCLPSPYRVPRSVAGMAFNFSKIRLSPHAARSKAPVQAETRRGPADSTRVKTRRSCFGISQYSPAT